MKNALWALGFLGSSLFFGRVSHATEGWVQIPGAATQIAVGANDIPFILDTNGYVEYLKPRPTVCGHGICVDGTREWQWLDITASVIAANQLGYLWMSTSTGSVYHMGPSSQAYSPALNAVPSAAILGSLAPGRMQLQAYPEWNYTFGTASGKHAFYPNEVAHVPHTTTYATGVGSPTLSSINVTTNMTYVGSSYVIWDTADPWQQVDTGELQVTQFTVDGAADQVPWITVIASAGIPTAFTILSPGNYHYVGSPQSFGIKCGIDWITDHYVAASKNSISGVWRWTGDAYGYGGQWSFLNNSNQLPNGGKIAKIAYASALPGTTVGTIGPSHLYMIDTNNNIYQWGTLGDPVK